MNEGQIVTRTIEVTWGGERKVLPVLPMKPADEWRRVFVETFPEVEADAEEMNVATALALAGSKVLDLMLAYDRTKVLGAREWIEENVTDDELVDAFVAAFNRSFRLGRLPMELMKSQMASSASAKSPNGRLPTGV